LKPAARGELKNHRSGIPRLTGRKGKGRGVKGGDYSGDLDEMMGYGTDMDDLEDDYAMQQRDRGQSKIKQKTGTIDQGSKPEDLCPEDKKELEEFLQLFYEMEHSRDPEEYYWEEEEYDITDTKKKQDLFDELLASATTDADGRLVAEVDDETFAKFEDAETIKETKSPKDQQQQQRGQQQAQWNAAPEFLLDTLGVKGFEKAPDPETYNRPLPLKLKGPTMEDFVKSMAEHPTKFGQLQFIAPHPESTREPIPDLPKGRRNPPLEFVESHTRFLYVWGLPPLLSVDEQPGDLENPLHALELQKTAAALFDVSPESVYPASISSAFIGFKEIKDHRFACIVGPIEKFVESPVQILAYSPAEGDKTSFDESEMDRVVVLDNLPSGLTPSALAKTLFPPGTDAGDLVYGGLTPDDFVMMSPHKAALRLETKEHAENAIKSEIVEQRLKDFGKHTIRYSKARRELVYTGKLAGVARDLERTPGPRLIVDGDMPKKNFYLSHAEAIYLRNLDPDVTKEDIANYFQPYCALPRDVEGSVEFITCHQGLPTGRAYVGFDELGEASAAMEANNRIEGLGHNTVVMKKVRDSRKIPREQRPARSDTELTDSLDNWEQYIDPKDLAELIEHGISKEALDEQLRSIRYHNPTFSGLDQAIPSESMDHQDSGYMYKELVQEYVETLKECLSTPENPGPVYESLFYPDEELDLEIFENEPARQEKLKKEREVP